MGCPWVSDEWKPLLEEEGWRGEFYYVIHEGPEHGVPPTVEDVRHLRTAHDIEHDLLYDRDGSFMTGCIYSSGVGGLPVEIIVNTDNMLVWCTAGGWYDDITAQAYFLSAVCELGAAHDPGYRP